MVKAAYFPADPKDWFSGRGDSPIFTKIQLPKTEIRPGLPILDLGDFFSGKFLLPIATMGSLIEI